MDKKTHSKDHKTGLAKFGKRQSPIALNRRFAYHVDIPRVKLDNFGIFSKANVKNTGHTIQVQFPRACHCNRPKISAGGLMRNYTLDNIHFHWPAEHTINGVRHDMEAHFVFYADKYGSVENAREHPYGLTVLGVMFSVTNFTRSQNFRLIAEAAELVSKTPGRSVTLKQPLNLYHFLPYDKEFFYHYIGSLTTPKYTEFVHWIVFNNAPNITYLDFKQIKSIVDHEGEPVESNNRELQDVNDRIVTLRNIV